MGEGDMTTLARTADLRRLVLATCDALATTTDLRTAVRTITNLAVEGGLADWSLIDLLDSRGKLHRLAAAHVDPGNQAEVQQLRRRGPPSPSERDLLWRVLRSGEPAMVPTINTGRDSDDARTLSRLGFASLLIVPLTDTTSTHGALTFVRGPSSPAYEEADRDTATAWAALCSTALSWRARYETAHRAGVVADAWRERERSRDETFADVSHDLRTPVAAISGAIEVFLRDVPRGIPPPLFHMLLIIEQETARMRALVDDVLELTGVDSGRARLYRRSTDLRVIARHAARAIEPLAAERRQHVAVHVPRYAVRASVDAPRLERALINIVGNAQRYAPEAGHVSVELQRRDGEAIFSVADNGPGIAPEDQARIFERFYRGSQADPHHGSGLGLPIARAMVELHSGRIWLDSAPGQGTTFHIAIPLE